VTTAQELRKGSLPGRACVYVQLTFTLVGPGGLTNTYSGPETLFNIVNAPPTMTPYCQFTPVTKPSALCFLLPGRPSVFATSISSSLQSRPRPETPLGADDLDVMGRGNGATRPFCTESICYSDDLLCHLPRRTLLCPFPGSLSLLRAGLTAALSLDPNHDSKRFSAMRAAKVPAATLPGTTAKKPSAAQKGATGKSKPTKKPSKTTSSKHKSKPKPAASKKQKKATHPKPAARKAQKAAPKPKTTKAKPHASPKAQASKAKPHASPKAHPSHKQG